MYNTNDYLTEFIAPCFVQKWNVPQNLSLIGMKKTKLLSQIKFSNQGAV